MTDEIPAAVPPRDTPQLKRAFLIALGFIGLLWLIKLIELSGPDSFEWLGVRPREWYGLLGVLTSPLIHGSFEHLIFNSFPTLVLLTLALFNYPKATVRAFALIWILSGIGIWLIGRPSWHFGASGLTHGLMFFLFFLGLMRQDRNAIVVAMVTFFLYGGMVITVLPRDPQVSWEAHMSGAVAGMLAAWLWRKLDPAAPEPKPSWELEGDEDPLDDDELEPQRPSAVPVLWQRADLPRGVVLRFPQRHATNDDERPPTLH